MFGLLHQYLVENRSVYLRGTGQLQLVRQSASLDVAKELLQPPRTNIQLVASEQAGSLQPLMAFISQQLNIAEENAFSLYEAFCNQLQEDISNKTKVSWSNLGTFSKDATGAVVFHPDQKLEQYEQPVTAIRSIRQNTTHSMTVGTHETTNTAMLKMLSEQTDEPVQSRWWIFALILGGTALLLIVLKKLQYL